LLLFFPFFSQPAFLKATTPTSDTPLLVATFGQVVLLVPEEHHKLILGRPDIIFHRDELIKAIDGKP
jgi:hypothetical protein